MMRNGYTVTDAGLLVRPEVTGETYLPANHELDTRPIAAVGEPAATAPVGVVNQAKQSETPLVAGPVQRWGTRRLVGRSATAAERAEVTDPAVIKARGRIRTAGQLEALKADPDAQAHGNRRARLLLLAMSGLGIALGVGISASTAQSTITGFMGWAADSVAAAAAYGADPALGLVLFSILGLRALASTRGVSLPAATATAFTRIEAGLFALVAVLNVGPSLGSLLTALVGLHWSAVGPAFMVLVIHCLGPLLVAAGVYGVPHMLAVLDLIRTATVAATDTGVGASNQQQRRHEQVPAKWHGDLEVVLAAIEAGALPLDPTGSQIYRHLGGGDAARKGPLRDAVAGYRPEEVAA